MQNMEKVKPKMLIMELLILITKMQISSSINQPFGDDEVNCDLNLDQSLKFWF